MSALYPVLDVIGTTTVCLLVTLPEDPIHDRSSAVSSSSNNSHSILIVDLLRYHYH